MRSLVVQLLASIIVFVSLSLSQEDGERSRRHNVITIDKQINIREVIRFGGRRSEEQGEIANFDVPENNEDSWSSLFSLSSLLTKASNAARLRRMKEVLPLSGLQWLDKGYNDSGKAVVCGPKGAHLDITWEPKVINSQKSVKIDFDIINPIDFDKGHAYLDVYQQGSSEPMFSVEQDISCSQITQLAPFIKCPLKKGERIQHSLQYGKLRGLKNGIYTVILKINSYEENPTPQLFACLNVTAQIVSSS